MPLGKTPILQNDLMAEGDNQKYLLFNDALVALEDADNRKRAVDLTDADYTLLESEILRYALFKCAGHTVARILTVPATVGDGTYACNRKFAVRNDGTAAVTVTNGGTGNEVTIAAGTTGLLHTDGTDVISLGGVSNAAAATVADDNATVVTTLTALKFSGTEFTVTDDGGGQATITVAVPKSLGDLDDIAAYTDNAGKILKVNDTEDGTEWVPLPANTLEGLSDVDALANNAGKVLAVKDTEDGGEWIDLPSGSLQALSDVDVPGITDGQGIVYDSATGKFVTYDLPPTLTAAEIKTLYESNANTNVFTSSEKQKLASITTSFFVGVYTDQTALEAAVTSPVAGNFAFLDAGAGSDPVMVIWDDNDAQWVTASAAAMTGADIVSAINTTLGGTDWQLAPLTNAEVVTAINTQLGNADWQSGGTTLPAYTANASKHLAVNATGDGLEWVDPPTGGAAYPDFTANASKHLAVNATEDGVEWVDPPSGGTGGGTYKGDWVSAGGFSFEDGLIDAGLTSSGTGTPTVVDHPQASLGLTKALKLGNIGASESQSISFPLDTTSITSLTIDYEVSSESGYDKFLVYSDQEGVSDKLTLLTDSGVGGGLEAFTVQTDTLDPGTRTITLTYSKDSSNSSGDDAVYISDIQLAAGSSAGYSLGDTVTYGGATYLSKADQNTSHPSSPDWAKMSALPDVTANGGKLLAVNSAGDGTEWIVPPSGSASYPDFTGNTGKVLKVNATEDGVEWAEDLQGSGGGSGASTPAEWQGARATIPDFSVASGDINAWHTAALSTVETPDPLGFFDVATGEITIPSGVSHVRFTAGIWKTSTSASSGSNQWKLFKNGTLLTEVDGTFNVEPLKGSGFSNSGETAVSATLEVVPGDVFTLRYYATNSSSYEGWIEVEPVGGFGDDTARLVVARSYWDGDPSYATHSTSAYASKGMIYTALKDVAVQGVTMNLASGQTVKCMLVQLSGPTASDTVTAVIAEAPARAITSDGFQEFVFGNLPLLLAGTTYGIIGVRTDATATDAIGITFPGSSPANDPYGYLNVEGAVRYESNDPQIGDIVFYSASSTVIVGVTYFDPETTGFVQNLKSVAATRTTDFSVSDVMLAGLVYIDVDSIAAARTITVPPGLKGTEPVTFERHGLNDVVFAAGAGVTINSPGGLLTMRGDYSVVSLKPKGNDVYTLMGDLA